MSQLSRTPEGYRYRLEALDIELEFRSLRSATGGVHSGLWADVVCTFGSGEKRRDVHEARYNLSSMSQRTGLAKFLASRVQLPAAEGGGQDWVGIIEAACIGVSRAWRDGHPSVNLGEGEEPSEPVYRVAPILQDGQFTVVYGDKASGKSALALAAAYSVADGVALLGLPVEPGPVYYLDWETDEPEQRRRLWRLARGLGAPELPTLRYFEMRRPLTEDADAIRRRIDQEGGAGLIVVDSLVPACGGNANDPESATALWHAVRRLKATVLCVAQTQKPSPGQRRARSVFGSVMFEYAARSIWRVRGHQEPGSNELDIAIFHEKCNNGALRKPLGWRMTFNDSARATMLEPQEPKAVPAFTDALPLVDQMTEVLKYGSRSAVDVAAELGKGENTIRAMFSKHRDRFTKVGNQWGLLDRNVAQQTAT